MLFRITSRQCTAAILERSFVIFCFVSYVKKLVRMYEYTYYEIIAKFHAYVLQRTEILPKKHESFFVENTTQNWATLLFKQFKLKILWSIADFT
jgi:hypothetical protein